MPGLPPVCIPRVCVCIQRVPGSTAHVHGGLGPALLRVCEAAVPRLLRFLKQPQD